MIIIYWSALKFLHFDFFHILSIFPTETLPFTIADIEKILIKSFCTLVDYVEEISIAATGLPHSATPGHILVMPNARLGGNKYRFCKSLVGCDWESNS